MIGAYINWLRSSTPRITVTALPEFFKEQVKLVAFKRIPMGSCSLYYGESPCGFVFAYYHNPSDETGLAGKTLAFPMEDGTTDSVKGVWETNPECVNSLLRDKDHVIEITLHLVGDSMNLSLLMQIEKVLPVLRKSIPDADIILRDHSPFGSNSYEVCIKDRDSFIVRKEAMDRQAKLVEILNLTWVRRKKRLNQKKRKF